MYKYHSLQILTLAFILPCFTFWLDQKQGIFDTSKQLVIVVSPKQNSVKAKLYKFEKKGKAWKQVGHSHPVNLGKNGLAWGRGINSPKPGLQKKEGDLRSPAGIFRFGTAFGYAPAGSLPLKLPYVPITETQLCIEDSNSNYYNQLVDATQVKEDCKALENMLRTDQQYKWGIFVKQNLPPEPESGSCIFFHLWRKPGSGTLGCTAMAEDNLLTLMKWLDPQKEPLLLQMTEASYREYQRGFSLPVLPTH
jgi:L,D-peptidoglycan transpeptidase YkuD (ErfK/YbiS/YcfS/YnhG family)